MTTQPPYTLTPEIVALVADIGEALGRYHTLTDQKLIPPPGRVERMRTIWSSLAIEDNALSLEQVTAVIDGHEVNGHPRQIQEVRNAFATYEVMDAWNPTAEQDLLAAHASLMRGLVETPGSYRSRSVGVFREEQLVHRAPPAEQVPELMQDLMAWLAGSDEHPLLASCIFHYQLEFIHPFADGNGQLGRLWQTLILRNWSAQLACLPVEAVMLDRREDYYRRLAVADRQADATAFIAFMLTALRDALLETLSTRSDPQP